MKKERAIHVSLNNCADKNSRRPGKVKRRRGERKFRESAHTCAGDKRALRNKRPRARLRFLSRRASAPARVFPINSGLRLSSVTKKTRKRACVCVRIAARIFVARCVR